MKKSLLPVRASVYGLLSVPAYGTPLEASRDRGQLTKKFLFALLFLTIPGLSGTARADTILLGSDYFAAVAGENVADKNSVFNFRPTDFPGLGTVDLKLFSVRGRLRAGPLGNTDTIIQRLEDATGFSVNSPPPFESAKVRARLQSMELASDGPVIIDGQAFAALLLFAPRGEGQLSIVHTFGDFNSTFGGDLATVLALPATLQLSLRPIGGRGGPVVSALPQDAEISLSGPLGAGVGWDTSPDANTLSVTGPPEDQAANTHVPLSSGNHDFYPDTATPWFMSVKGPGIEFGQVEMRAAKLTTTVPDAGPGVMGLSLVIGLIGCHSALIRRRRATGTERYRTGQKESSSRYAE